MDSFVGQIMLTALTFAPQNWVYCDGSALSLNDNENLALYSLINITYGGDGSTTFCVPDLRGAIPIGINYSFAPIYELGATGGLASNMPLARGATTNSGSTRMTYAAGEIPQDNLPPFIGLSYIICVQGLYPMRP
jgi:microcystin-dependent protein